MLKQKYKVEPSRMFATVEAAARRGELTLDLTKQRFMYPTVRAHTLLRHAERKGTQPALVRALFEEYFQEAKNISDVEELVRIAGSRRLRGRRSARNPGGRDELSVTGAIATEAARGGIRGVLSYVFRRQDRPLGALSWRPCSAKPSARRRDPEREPSIWLAIGAMKAAWAFASALRERASSRMRWERRWRVRPGRQRRFELEQRRLELGREEQRVGAVELGREEWRRVE